MKKHGAPVSMPPVADWGSHLLGYLFEIGPVGNDQALTIRAFLDLAEALGIEFEPWESRLLLRLSREYYGAMHAAAKWNADPPWDGCIPDFRQMAEVKAAAKHAEEERRMDLLFSHLAKPGF